LRPLARRLASTLRPPTVAMRERKPWRRLRTITLGWYVRFKDRLRYGLGVQDKDGCIRSDGGEVNVAGGCNPFTNIMFSHVFSPSFHTKVNGWERAIVLKCERAAPERSERERSRCGYLKPVRKEL
jgi:hypothetical protein